MDKETFLSTIQEIGTCEDIVDIRTKLTDLSDSMSEVFDRETELNTNIDSLNETINKNNEKIQKLQEANMDFYLKLNAQKTKEQVQAGSTGINPEPNKRKFEDLFKKEGGNE